MQSSIIQKLFTLLALISEAKNRLHSQKLLKGRCQTNFTVLRSVRILVDDNMFSL